MSTWMNTGMIFHSTPLHFEKVLFSAPISRHTCTFLGSLNVKYFSSSFQTCTSRSEMLFAWNFNTKSLHLELNLRPNRAHQWQTAATIIMEPLVSIISIYSDLNESATKTEQVFCLYFTPKSQLFNPQDFKQHDMACRCLPKCHMRHSTILGGMSRLWNDVEQQLFDLHVWSDVPLCSLGPPLLNGHETDVT